MKYLSKGNKKLGKILSFDIPAVETCPGATPICKKYCYAKTLQNIYKYVGKKYKRNLKFSHSSKFVQTIVEEIPANAIVRIHTSGDFYSINYINKWRAIVSQRPDIKFYCYTRSWRIPHLWTAILKLSQLPNIVINLSTDVETGKPSNDDFRYTFMSHDNSAPSYLRQTDLIFRTNKRNKHTIHNINNIRVCPLERGKNSNVNTALTCLSCKICLI